MSKKCFLFIGVMAMVLMVCALTACGSAEEEPTPTYRIIQPTSKPTKVLPRPGHWEGDPKVTLDISGTTAKLKLVAPIGKRSPCTLSSTVTLSGMYLQVLTVNGIFSDQEHISGDYTVVSCGGLLPTPVSGNWNAHWVSE